ncbi:hypothetical protein [Caldanaerobacter subterraneus]|uniref:CopG family transcriptional regulator n=1 Tax=Caldanaerobacter subterraneus TaxID=911092 RepID=A0A7Y2PJZ7_9THEO|nr:hypothetical protein [Caldanaerobacter subterraneus]NNG66429.1 hypothetical protein [Caldanaerobacter subterraneus]
MAEKNDKNLTIRINSQLWEEFKKTCYANGAVPSRVVKLLMEKYIEKNKESKDDFYETER